MKKALKIFGIILISLIAIIIIIFLVFSVAKGKAAKELYTRLGVEAPQLTVVGHTFRDLNKNGSLDVYEDSRAELEARVTILDKNFEVLTHLGDNPDRKQWARNPIGPDQWKEGIFIAPHGVSFDESGDLYVMDWNRSGRISKLVWQK